MSKVPVPWLTLPDPRNSSALKKACVKRWKMPIGDSARRQAQHHVAKLADGGVGQHTLDIVHHQSHAGGENGGESADDGDH